MTRGQLFYIFLSIFFTAGCSNEKLDVNWHEVTLNDGQFVLDFESSSDYTYDSTKIELSSNKAQLKSIDQTHSGSKYSSGSFLAMETNINGDLSLKSSINNSLNSSWTPEYSAIIGYWKFDGTLGQLPNSATIPATIGNNLTSNSTNSSGVSYVKGKIGESLLLSGDGDDSLNVSGFTGELKTISLWVKFKEDRTDSDSSVSILVFGPQDWFKYGGQGTGSCSNELALVGKGSGNRSCWRDWTATIEHGWHHIAFVWDSDNSIYKFYLDGVSKPITVTGSMTYYNLVSASFNLLNPFSQSMIVDEMAIWEKSLTDDQIQTIYDRQSQSFSDNLSLSSTWTPQWSQILGHWNMDYHWLDSSSKNSDGTGNNGASFTAIDAKINSHSASFDGVDDYFEVPNSSNFQNLSEISVAFWAKLKSPINSKSFVIKAQPGDTSTVGWNLGLDSSTPAKLNWNVGRLGALSAVVSSNYFLPLNTWTHIVGIYDGAQLKLYVNGKQQSDVKSFTGLISSDTNSTNVLRAGYQLNSTIDDLAIWDKALSFSEIQTIYNHQKQSHSGSFESPMISLSSESNWAGLTPKTSLPFYKELPGDINNDSIADSELSEDYSQLVGSTGSTSDNNLANKLVGVWHFNETNLGSAPSIGAGNTDFKDYSGLSNHATITNGSCVLAEPGLLANSVFLNNADIKITSLKNLMSNGAHQISYSTWIKTGTTEIAELFTGSVGIGGQTHVQLSLNKKADGTKEVGTARMIVAAQSSSYSQTFDSTAITDGQWHHVVFIIDADTEYMSVYLDGKLHYSYTGSSASPVFQEFSDTTELHSSFLGHIDETALWKRKLHSQEVLQLYRRGANRIKYQVRSCDDLSCSGESWQGPDGNSSTYFSELFNKSQLSSVTDQDGDSDIDLTDFILGGLSNTSAPSFNFSDFSTIGLSLSNNQHFQYKVIMESEDQNNLCASLPCFPDLKNLSAEPNPRYFSSSPSITSKTEISFKKIDSIKITADSCVSFVVSNNGTNFYYWNGSAWTQSTSTSQTSNSTTIEQNISSFHSQVGTGKFYIKAYLNSSGSTNCGLSTIIVDKR